MTPKFPRSCEIESHQFHATGLCWALTDKGIALVEHESGKVARYDLTTVYTLKFTDDWAND